MGKYFLLGWNCWRPMMNPLFSSTLHSELLKSETSSLLFCFAFNYQTMAILANRVAAMGRTLGLFRNSSINLIRRFSASSTTPTSPIAAAPSTVSNNKPKRKKKKNLFEVAQFLPNWGIGYQMAKTHWVGLSYQITKVNLYKDGQHGKAWGIVHKEGAPAADAPRKISGVHKRFWKYIPTKKMIESTPKAEALAA